MVYFRYTLPCTEMLDSTGRLPNKLGIEDTNCLHTEKGGGGGATPDGLACITHKVTKPSVSIIRSVGFLPPK